MAPRATCLAVAAAMTAFLSGCTTMPGDSASVRYERRLVLPADTATALGAGALRQMFPFADPVMQAAGAPANLEGAGRFSIAYEQDRAGNWLPCATHRLLLAAATSATQPAVVEAQALVGNHRLMTRGHAACGRFELTITAHRDPGSTAGCLVAGTLPADLAPQIAEALDRTFAIAVDACAPQLGLCEPNLRVFVGERLLLTAARLLAEGRPQLAAEQLHKAARLDDGSPARQRRLGDLAARSGDVALASDHLLQAMLVTPDQTTRAHLAVQLASLATEGVASGSAHRSARERFTALDLGVAEILLHTARRHRPEPALDYQRLGEVHSLGHDDMGELACVLLAREHAPAAIAQADSAGAPWQRGLTDLTRRLRLGILTVVAESATQPPVLRPAASPTR